jgi:hypothetical protein
MLKGWCQTVAGSSAAHYTIRIYVYKRESVQQLLVLHGAQLQHKNILKGYYLTVASALWSSATT